MSPIISIVSHCLMTPRLLRPTWLSYNFHYTVKSGDEKHFLVNKIQIKTPSSYSYDQVCLYLIFAPGVNVHPMTKITDDLLANFAQKPIKT